MVNFVEEFLQVDIDNPAIAFSVYILLLSLPRHERFVLVETHNYGLKMSGHIKRLILGQSLVE